LPALSSGLHRRRPRLGAQTLLAVRLDAARRGDPRSALVRHDFTFAYVSAHTEATTCDALSLSGFWGGRGLADAMVLVLNGYGASPGLQRKLLNE